MLILVPVFLIGGLLVASAGPLIDAGCARRLAVHAHPGQAMRAARAAGELPLLAVATWSVGYDGVTVLDGVDIEVAEGEIVALIGTNGAGKSTLLRAIGGIVEADRGAVVFNGRDITHVPPGRDRPMGHRPDARWCRGVPRAHRRGEPPRRQLAGPAQPSPRSTSRPGWPTFSIASAVLGHPTRRSGR